MQIRTLEQFSDREVSRKSFKSLYGDVNIYYKNCTLKPKYWLLVFIIGYMYHCNVNLIENPSNILLLEKANENWLPVSNTPFELKDVNQVINKLIQKGLIVNEDGYVISGSNPMPILTAVKNVLKIITTQPVKF